MIELEHLDLERERSEARSKPYFAVRRVSTVAYDKVIHQKGLQSFKLCLKAGSPDA